MTPALLAATTMTDDHDMPTLNGGGQIGAQRLAPVDAPGELPEETIVSRPGSCPAKHLGHGQYAYTGRSWLANALRVGSILTSKSTPPPPTTQHDKQAGQEKFHALGPIYYREANGALLVYDVTSPESLRKVRDWVRELNKMLGQQNVCLAIIGNKSDLLSGGGGGHEQRRESRTAGGSSPEAQLVQEAIQLSEELPNARHHLTSAKLNQGVGELFVSLSRRMIEQQRRLALERHDSRLLLASSRVVRSGRQGRAREPAPAGDAASPRVVDGRPPPGTNGSGKRAGGSCQC
jgi:hypothetical protein